MDYINITTCPTDEDILSCFDYRICKYMLHNDCIYADRCKMLHRSESKEDLLRENALKIQRGDNDVRN